mmetsp:Transcript_45764/g.139042  ORF Transcript_45764/g.139042 Transcript_45764/m.139042 type:complete len:548 (-) Transcript_45764:12-1655(-)
MPSFRKLLPSSSRLSASMPWGYEWNRRVSSSSPTSRHDVGSTRQSVDSASYIHQNECFPRRSTRAYPPGYLPLLILLAVVGFYFTTVSLLWVNTDTIVTGHARIDELARPLRGQVEDRPEPRKRDTFDDSVESPYLHSRESTKKVTKRTSSQHKTASRDDHDNRQTEKKKSTKYGYEYGPSPHPKTKPKKHPAHSHSQARKDKPRRSGRGASDIEGRRVIDPKGKGSGIESSGSGGAKTKRENNPTAKDPIQKGISEDLRVVDDDHNKRLERAAVSPDPSVASTNDLVVGLAVTAAVAIVALLGALLYIFAQKGKRTTDKSTVTSESQTDCSSMAGSSESNHANEAREPVALRSHLEADNRLLHAYRSLEPVVQGSSKCPSTRTAQFSVTVPTNVQPGQDFRVFADDQVISVKCPSTTKSGEKVRIFIEKGAVIVDEGIETKEERFVPSPPSTRSVKAKKDLEQQSPTFLQLCKHMDASESNSKESAKNPQEGASSMFEVKVPKGVEPGQPFPVMVEGNMVAVTCPTGLSTERKIMFQLPNDIAAGV